MSRDFTPRECWLVNSQDTTKDLYLSNISYTVDGKTWKNAYTEEELSDRREHKYLAVLGCDIYAVLKSSLTDEQFKKLNNTLGELVDADMAGYDLEDTDVFPPGITDWYFNRHDHYYHEPNDEEFVNWVKENWPEEK